MKCPYSTTAQWIIALLSIFSAVIFQINFHRQPIYIPVILVSFVVFLLCGFVGVVFRGKAITAFYADYILWFFYTFSMGFEVATVLTDRFFK